MKEKEKKKKWREKNKKVT